MAEKKKYAEAHVKYNEAHKLDPLDPDIAERRGKAAMKVKAAKLIAEGAALFKDGEYVQAKAKFLARLGLCIRTASLEPNTGALEARYSLTRVEAFRWDSGQDASRAVKRPSGF